MSKAQGWILAALILTALINIFSSPQAIGLLTQGHPIQAADIGNPLFALYWVVALIALLLFADAEPTLAGWIAAIILLGALLYKWLPALQVLLKGGK